VKENYGLCRYEYQKDIVDLDMLKGDELTFSVLMTTVNTGVECVFTDHKSIIISYSCAPYPVWVWCRSDIDDKSISKIAACLKGAFPLDQGFEYNLSCDLFERLRRSDPAFADMKIKLDMIIMQCTQMRYAPDGKTKGHRRLAAEWDFDFLVQCGLDFELEAEGKEITVQIAEQRARKAIDNGRFWIWEDGDGYPVATASCDDLGRIGSVYTLPAHRRNGYAYHLVGQLVESALQRGIQPFLYANGNYPNSCGCYRKIGFEQIGRIYQASGASAFIVP